MKKMIYGFLILFSVSAFTSCDTLVNNLPDGLSTDEIVSGLKTALKVGADSSTTLLHAENGYYKDALVKILLPPEAQPMLKYVSQIEAIAGTGFVENTILSLNRSAEKAATEAKPIFVDAITNITIADGLNILNGKSTAKTAFDSIAATNYLKTNTFQDLTALYAPKMDAVLNLPLIQTKGNLSTNDLWKELVKYYNMAIDAAVIASILSNDPIVISLSKENKIDQNLTLGQFATEKALDGLFFKVGEEEKKIRKNPYQWAMDILDKVFGSVYVAPTE